MISRKIIVYRDDGIFECVILKYKNEDKYSWCNLTKGHICTCKFDTYEDAINDIYKYIQSGKVKTFKYYDDSLDVYIFMIAVLIPIFGLIFSFLLLIVLIYIYCKRHK